MERKSETREVDSCCNIVKTKTEDGGNQEATTESNGQVDAFNRYSNNNVRMMNLIGLPR